MKITNYIIKYIKDDWEDDEEYEKITNYILRFILNISITSLSIILINLLIYLLLSFVILDFNIFNWEIGVRFVFVLISCSVILIAIIESSGTDDYEY